MSVPFFFWPWLIGIPNFPPDVFLAVFAFENLIPKIKDEIEQDKMRLDEMSRFFH